MFCAHHQTTSLLNVCTKDLLEADTIYLDWSGGATRIIEKQKWLATKMLLLLHANKPNNFGIKGLIGDLSN